MPGSEWKRRGWGGSERSGMEYLVNAEQMRRYDRNTSDFFHVPPVVLMERAALACLTVIRERQKKISLALAQAGESVRRERVLVVAGTGNNGGDGFALGRLLLQEGWIVDFVLIGPPEKAGELTRLQMESVRAYGGVIRNALPDQAYDIVIDALFGIGLTRPLEGTYREAVEYMNRQDAWTLSADIPSGIHADTGQIMGTAVYADVTVTFGFRKLGLFWYPGARCAGKIVCAPIGITLDSCLGRLPGAFTYTEPITALLPGRLAEGNKGTFGKVTLLAGSPGMEGAGLLCAKGAFSAGCGMVKLVGDQGLRTLCLKERPETMVTDRLEEALGWADVIAAGPGLSASEEAAERLGYVIEHTDQPLVLDADAITLLAKERSLYDRLVKMQRDGNSRRKLVMTPHPGELARLLGQEIRSVLEDPVGCALGAAETFHAIVLCKGARTAVAQEAGPVYLNSSGNSGMATAGSGDVLTGILASILAQGGAAFSNVCAGVYLHGLAGDWAAHRKGEYSMTAGDIAEAVPEVLCAGTADRGAERRREHGIL